MSSWDETCICGNYLDFLRKTTMQRLTSVWLRFCRWGKKGGGRGGAWARGRKERVEEEVEEVVWLRSCRWGEGRRGWRKRLRSVWLRSCRWGEGRRGGGNDWGACGFALECEGERSVRGWLDDGGIIARRLSLAEVGGLGVGLEGPKSGRYADEGDTEDDEDSDEVFGKRQPLGSVRECMNDSSPFSTIFVHPQKPYGALKQIIRREHEAQVWSNRIAR